MRLPALSNVFRSQHGQLHYQPLNRLSQPEVEPLVRKLTAKFREGATGFARFSSASICGLSNGDRRPLHPGLPRGGAPPIVALMESWICRRDPEIMSGELCFTGTRVPVEVLFDYLEEGDSVARFLEGFPTVRREQVEAVLAVSRRLVLADERVSA